VATERHREAQPHCYRLLKERQGGQVQRRLRAPQERGSPLRQRMEVSPEGRGGPPGSMDKALALQSQCPPLLAALMLLGVVEGKGVRRSRPPLHLPPGQRASGTPGTQPWRRPGTQQSQAKGRPVWALILCASPGQNLQLQLPLTLIPAPPLRPCPLSISPPRKGWQNSVMPEVPS
jgi:hypothetical protein